MLRVASEALAGSGRVKEVEEDLGGSWTVPECMEGPRLCRRFQGGSSMFLGVFYSLGGPGRVQEGPRGSGRVQEGLGVLGGSGRVCEGVEGTSQA